MRFLVFAISDLRNSELQSQFTYQGFCKYVLDIRSLLALNQN
jgi:hypothetical protein